MKSIYYYTFLAVATALCCASCNNEWEDEQFEQMVSFKAVPNSKGVTSTYIRYTPNGVVTYDLPVLLSGSTMSTQNRTVHVAVDQDTLGVFNREWYGDREELYYQMLEPEYYSFPETVDIAQGECSTTLPISFTLGGDNNQNMLDLSEKWILPLTIVDDPGYGYESNPRKYYRKALLNVIPFNDYSGTYSGTQCMIYLESGGTAFTVAQHKAYVYDENTIFFYAGLRDEDYLDRQKYKVFFEFTDELLPFEGSKKKLRLWSDNGEADGNAFQSGEDQAYYTVEEEFDAKKPYLKHIYITLSFSYSFEDYTISPGNRLKYTVSGTLSLQRDLNTLIPDEDQQIQWD